MLTLRPRRTILAAAAVALLAPAAASAEVPAEFNGGTLTFPAQGAATPYGTPVTVSGLSGSVTDVDVVLKGVGHTFPADIDLLLVSPAGQAVMLMSDAGGSDDVTGVDLTLDDQAPGGVPSPLATGTYRPTDNDTGDAFPPTGTATPDPPAGPYPTTLSTFAGTAPNGQWRLYGVDDASGDMGSMSGGWTLKLYTGRPDKVTNPTIGGTAQEGQTLSVTSNGTWTGAPTAYEYQWLRCNPSACSPEAVGGATAASYPLTAQDVGKWVWVMVTARNGAGENSATSTTAGPVTAASGGGGGTSGGGAGGGGAGGGGATPDLELVSVSASPDPVRDGGVVTFTVTARNNGPVTANRVFIGVEGDSLGYEAGVPPQTCPGGAGGPAQTCGWISVPAGQTVTATMPFQVDGEPLDYTATVTTAAAPFDANRANNSRTGSVSVLTGEGAGGRGGRGGGGGGGGPGATRIAVTQLLVVPGIFRAARAGASLVALPGRRPTTPAAPAPRPTPPGGSEPGSETTPTDPPVRRRPRPPGATEPSGEKAAVATGAVVTYRLGAAARSTFRVLRPAAGRQVGRACQRPTRANRMRRACVRWVLLPGSFTHLGAAGVNRFRFTGRLAGRRLAVGRYRLQIVAGTGASRSLPRVAPFRIRR